MSTSDANEPDTMFITRKWAPATGGMETYCLRLTERLAASAPLDVVALPGRANGMPPSAMALLGFPFTVALHLLRRKQAPRVVHLADMAIWPLGLLLPGSSRIVLSAHGTDVAYHRRGGIKGRLYGAYLRLGARLLRRARVIANSQATADVLQETGWQASAVVPLATEMQPPETAPATGRFVLFAGRLVERKGCGWFIEHVLPHLPEGVTLKVAGTRWDAGESALLAHPNVEFLGPQDAATLARLYAEALCVVVPNIDVASGEYEGFGLVAPEAASAGAVVLAARSGGLTDAVIDGETGFLLLSGEAPRWIGKIAQVAAWTPEERAAFTSRSATRAQEYFSWDRVAEQTMAAYRAA